MGSLLKTFKHSAHDWHFTKLRPADPDIRSHRKPRRLAAYLAQAPWTVNAALPGRRISATNTYLRQLNDDLQVEEKRGKSGGGDRL